MKNPRQEIAHPIANQSLTKFAQGERATEKGRTMSVYPGGAYSPVPPQIDFGVIGRAWELFRAQMGAWIGAAAVLLLISLLVGVPAAFLTGFAGQYMALVRAPHDSSTPPNIFGLLGSEMLFIFIVSMVGYVLLDWAFRMALKAARGERVAVGDLLSISDVILPLIGVGLINMVCVYIGSLLCVLPGLVVAGLFMFAPLLVVDRKLGAMAAIQESINILKSQWLMATAFYFVVTLLYSFSIYLCGVGILAGFPIFVLSVALNYLALTQPRQPVVDYG